MMADCKHPHQIQMSPTQALALAILVIDEAVEFPPAPADRKERQGWQRWLRELQAARVVIARMMAESNGKDKTK